MNQAIKNKLGTQRIIVFGFCTSLAMKVYSERDESWYTVADLGSANAPSSGG